MTAPTSGPGDHSTLVEILRWRAVHQPDQRAYTFLTDGEAQEQAITYRALDARARAIAAVLHRLDARGQRALLVYPSGLEYICAFFGGLYGGAVNVPAYPPGRHALQVHDRYLQRLEAIARDARPRVALTTSQVRAAVEPLLPQLPELQAIRWVATDDGSNAGGQDGPDTQTLVTRSADLAFLQYTSGSTSTPKGVLVSHGNLMVNAEMYRRGLGLSETTVVVNWMPLFHDFGLIGHVLQAMYLGAPCIILEPAAFVQHPLRWLAAISRHRGTVSGAPNFAYELCLRKITPAQRRTLDLSCWQVALNAAEPVRADTLDRFAAAFSSCGFRREAATPVYGLAEATLIVSGGVELYPHTTCHVLRGALEHGRVVEAAAGDPDAKTVVGCGRSLLDQRIVIADPETGAACPADRVGEIWVSGPSVAGGYWNRPEETARTFQAHLRDTGEGPFLRTGDLGFLRGEDLYITGRHKDLIILRGTNHHPQDLELTAERAHPALRPGNGAAFRLEAGGEERFGLVHEVVHGFAGAADVVEEIFAALRQAFSEQHGVDALAIVLIKTGSICKTTSGKIQRQACRAALLQDELHVVAAWREGARGDLAGGAQGPAGPAAGRRVASAAELQAWLIARLAEALNIEPAEVRVHAPFARHGLSSLAGVGLAGDLATWLGCALSPTLLYEYPTIDALSRYLAGEHDARPPAGEADAAKTRRLEPGEPIAVIGMMCRFPGGARDPEAFWQLLRDGRDAITPVPAERWDVDVLYDPDPDAAGRLYSRHGGFLDGVDRFDAGFFGIAPREAMTMDPQQRLLLEVSWEALERAGQPPDKLVGSQTGVFVGIGSHDYELLAGGLMGSDTYVGTGNLGSAAAGRLSYVLGLHGPSLAVDTACSSSLVAIHLACQSLRAGECTLALAGGVQLILAPDLTAYLCRLHALSPDGRCKTFDAAADGYVRGEGCGMVVLKRLSDAERDGDSIRAVIRGSAVNHDGRSNGLTAPNGRAQEALLRQALGEARLAPGDVDYVEAHGTGTALGDPIEVRALGAVLGAGRPMTRPLAIGSVKTNLGHLEAAAGVAGFLKVVLALQHGELPPHLHLKEHNPYIPWGELAVVVPTERTRWPADGKPRIAGVSSFGVSGTNAHVILEAAPAAPVGIAAPARVQILPLSAHSPAALRDLVTAYRGWLTAPSAAELRIDEIAWTASVRRAHHEHRRAVVGRSVQDWVEALEAALSEPRADAGPGDAQRTAPRIVFVFSGHGSQWVGMGRQLRNDEPVFRAALEACDDAIRRAAGWSVLDELQADDGAVTRDLLDITQPLIFAMEVALAALWRSWGVTPDAVVGHSLGEVAAAHVAGALSLPDAARVICRRSELLMKIKGQGMMALVELSEDDAERALRGHADRLAVAVSNSSGSTVLSGAPDAMEAVLAQLEARGVGCRRLPWAVAAGHSPQVDALLPELRAALTELTPRTAHTAMYSTVTAEDLAAQALDAGYWLRNLRAPVKFSQTIRRMLDDGHDLFLEISPHPILITAIEEALDHRGRGGAALPSLRRKKDERHSLLESLAALYGRGHAPAFERLHPAGVRCVDLPPYPWQRERYWFDQVAPGTATGPRRSLATATATARDGHPLLGRGWTSSIQPDSHFWEQPLSVAALPYLSDHRVEGEVVFAAAGYIEMALGAAAEVHGAGPHVLRDLTFEHLLALPSGQARTVQTVLVEHGPGRSSIQISSREGEGWVRHATATTRPVEPMEIAHDAPAMPAPEPPRQIQARCATHVLGAEHYRQMQARGATYGPAFQGVAELWIGTGEALGRVRVPAAVAAQTAAYRCHPGLLDACLQTMAGLVPAPVPGKAALVMPVHVSRLGLHASPGHEVWVHARLQPPADGDAGAITADLVIMDAAANVVAEIRGLRVAPLEPRAGAGRDPADAWLYARQWQRREPAAPSPELPPGPQGETPQGAWWVLVDRGQTGAALAARLERRGQRCVQVMAGPHNARIAPGRYQIDPRDPQAFRALATELGADPCLGVVHLWSLDVTPVAATTHRTLVADQDLGCLSALHLAQALIGAGWQQLPRLHLVTRGAQAAGPPAHGVAVGQAPLWGLGRVMALEHPELRCRCVDLELDPLAPAQEAERLLGELLRDDREDQVALRADGRHVARLVRTTFAADDAAVQEPARGRPFRLVIREPGLLDRLTLEETPRRPPGSGEVEIEVEAAGLNFKDVLAALGALGAPGAPGAPGAMPAELGGSDASGPPLGGECAGTVVAVGEGVVDLQVGQDVLAFCVAGGALGSFVTTSRAFVAPRPAGLSFAQAATIPAVYLTAYYALAHVAQLRPGERVLIHAGAGGVGMAAIQYAQHVGAEIFATAGSADKRDVLRALGVPHVMDSRSLGFADEVMRITRREGVDVVLNSLSGEAIARSLGVLRRYGRFVEIGVRDYLQDRALGLKPFLNNLSFSLVDLVHLAIDRPRLVEALLHEVLQLFASGAFHPLPCRSFPISRAAEAFDHMAKAKHTGKVALSLRDPDVRIVPAAGGGELRGDGSYLITGGLGGLGLGLARWLVERGARHLVLIGRGAPSIEARDRIAAIEQAGAQVVTARADVSRPDDVAALLRDLDRRLPPLRGIVHAAAVLDDGTVLELDAERFARPMAPKLLGAWNLHALTLDQPLDFFVLYSSAAALLGSPGQASYAAGNAFLEALARHRRQLGRCALTIDWGPFSEAGGAAAQAQRGERLAARGVHSLTPAQGQDVLGRLLRRSRAQIGVLDFDAAQWTRCYSSEAGSPFLSELVGGGDAATARAPDAPGFLAALQTAPPEARPALLEAHLAEQLGRVLRLDAAAIGRQAAFPSLGLDSLMGLELRNRLAPGLGVKLSAAVLAAHPTVAALAAHLVGQLGAQAGAGAVRDPDDFRADAVLDPAICPPVRWHGPERPRARVLLTGATGFLGAFLLRELLDQTPYEIACLVRAPDVAHGHARLRQALLRHELWRPEDAARMIPIVGDLAQPRLGLSEAAFDDLAGSVDEIYHDGALVDWHDPYASMRVTNVLGTQEILQLGARGRIKPVHYLSSIATLAPLMSAGGVLQETDEPDWQPRDFDLLGSGYVQSKWVAERKVLLARARGYPVAIYRPGFITGDSRRGTWVAPDFLYDLVKGCIQLGLAPAWNASVGMVAVDRAAQAIVHIARQPGCLGETFHVLGQLGSSGDPELSFAGLWDHIRRRGYPLDVVPHAEFHRALEQAVAAGRGNPLRSYTHHLRTAIFSAPRTLELDCRVAREFLHQVERAPCSTAQLLDTYFDQMERSGFLAR